MKLKHLRRNEMTGPDIPQDTKRNRSNNQYTEVSVGYNEDSRRDQHNNYRNRANDLTSQYQQSNHECHQHIRNIRGPMILNPKQYRELDILNSKNVG